MIYDLENNPISNFSFAMAAETEVIFEIRIDCVDGYHLTCEPTGNVQVSGRREGDNTWIDLETSSIELSEYSGARITFEIRIETSAIVANVRVNPRLKVAKP